MAMASPGRRLSDWQRLLLVVHFRRAAATGPGGLFPMDTGGGECRSREGLEIEDRVRVLPFWCWTTIGKKIKDEELGLGECLNREGYTPSQNDSPDSPRFTADT
ncbi:hypothetical protein Droror1_Dr00004892 [Drosera rotundifolia]